MLRLAPSKLKRVNKLLSVVAFFLLAVLIFIFQDELGTFLEEENLLALLKEYGYVILFFWSILEGEAGLVMAGLLVHMGDMSLLLAIFWASFGGFVGDQIYFYIGRFNKTFIHKELRSHRRKFALAHVLLKKYGWPVIFMQRYLYGMRTVIPMAIGLTRYSAKKFAFINYISAVVWASLTIILATIFGEEILELLHLVTRHWFYVLPFAFLFLGGTYYYFHQKTKRNR